MAKKKAVATLRKPPSPRGLGELDLFDSAGAVPPLRTSIHELRPSAAPRPSAPKSMLTRELQVALEPALAEQLSLHCLSCDLELDSVVAKAIREHLSSRAAGPRPPPRPSEDRLEETWQAFGFVD